LGGCDAVSGLVAVVTSTAEREIRDAVVARLRALRPEARIVHELNVDTGRNRIDVAAISSEELIAVEIKSERDKTNRLVEQAQAFAAVSHHLIVCAHEKHWSKASWQRDDLPPSELPALKKASIAGPGPTLWRYPEIEGGYREGEWREPRDRFSKRQWQPHATRFLDLLWRDELFRVCRRHRIPVDSRSSRLPMIGDCAWLMTGREICRAVCAELRCRPFAEADPPVELEQVTA
jgi:hypothetical protein